MREIISDILSLGIRVPADIIGRRSGAGPAEGRALLIDGFPVNASISSPYAASSPYTLKNSAEGYILCKNGQNIAPVTVVPEPAFYTQKTGQGIEYRKIALLHGQDCLATTVLQRCCHWRTAQQCAFCATEISLKNGLTLARKTPRQLAEVALAAKTLDHVSHVVLTAGTAEPPGTELAYLAECAQSIKHSSGLPLHVQFAPPADLTLMDALYHAGVDTVGIHIESFDAATLTRVAPAKARIGLTHYLKAWRRAVGLFGPNQVSSFLIAGMGEPISSLLQGSEQLADMGVYPFLVPLRPIHDTRIAIPHPPDPVVMQPVYEAVAAILQRKGLIAAGSKAGCVRCGACSALAAYEGTPADLVYHRARTPLDIEAALRIRHEVFVTEQKIFKNTDIDEHDDFCTLIVAKKGETVVGTVRVYAQNGNGYWIGGRLAVSPPYRTGSVGSQLVKEAVKHVQRQGCTLFTAHIQQQNVQFFEKIGWKIAGPLEEYMGRPHQLMQAVLNTAESPQIAGFNDSGGQANNAPDIKPEYE